MTPLTVGESKILIKYGLLSNCSKIILENFQGSKIFIITDKNVARIYLNELSTNLRKLNFTVNVIVFNPGESIKTLHNAEKIYKALAQNFMSKSDLVIALGGGVITDITGFVASTYHRGINLINIPTSFLAMIDASIGGKNAVNSVYSKNMVGTFYYPKFVFIDPKTLESLPRYEFNSGIAESIKCGAIKDEKLFEILESQSLSQNISEILIRSINVKKAFVEQDKMDLDKRMILNFGHTIGHALEKIYNYKNISHGMAVATGMNFITEISESMGLTDKGTYLRLKEVCKRYSLIKKNQFTQNEMFNIICQDKKVVNQVLNLILLKKIGEGFIHKISLEKFGQLIKKRDKI